MFKIFKLENEEYNYLIVATSTYNPMNSLDYIMKQLDVEQAVILFDLVLVTGLGRSRYIECDYKSNLDLSFCFANCVRDSIKAISFDYFEEKEKCNK